MLLTTIYEARKVFMLSFFLINIKNVVSISFISFFDWATISLVVILKRLFKYTVWFKYKGPKVFGDFDQKSLVPGNFSNTLF